MKEKFFINARIVDPSQNLDENGGLIVDAKGKIIEQGNHKQLLDNNGLYKKLYTQVL